MNQFYEILQMVQVALGIGLVIFVHEAGHFIAARMCGVRVDVFSIGFGPPLLTWRRGTTNYQLSMVPLGGFVQMAGEVTHGRDEPRPPADDELAAKSVGQRFFIYSAGVLMNLAFGVVVFPILFAVGVQFNRPILGEPAPGGPAWQAGIQSGTEVLEVDGEPVYDFMHVATAVALGGDRSELLVKRPGSDTPSTVVVRPEYNEVLGFRTIQVPQSYHPQYAAVVRPDSAAWRAGMRTGDHVLGVDGAVETLSPVRQFAIATRDSSPVRLRVATPDENGVPGPERVLTIEPELVTENVTARLGIRPTYNRVLGVRENAALASLGIAPDDRLVELEGHSVLLIGDVYAALRDYEAPLDARVRRGDQELDLVGDAVTPEQALAMADALGVGLDMASAYIVVEDGAGAAQAGALSGDKVVSVDGERVDAWGATRERVAAATRAGRPIQMVVERGGEEQLALTATAAVVPVPDYGFGFQDDTYIFRAASPLEAVEVGIWCSWRLVEDTWKTLRGMMFGSVSTEQIGGIITIARVSHSFSEAGLTKLFFFLCMLSINLAFLNVLPIPVLDGGHLFFLIVEKIKGSPVSDRVLGYSQMVGLVLIVSLMVYVTFNDIQRWLG